MTVDRGRYHPREVWAGFAEAFVTSIQTASRNTFLCGLLWRRFRLCQPNPRGFFSCSFLGGWILAAFDAADDDSGAAADADTRR